MTIPDGKAEHLRWRRLSEVASNRVRSAEQRAAEVARAESLALRELDELAGFCARPDVTAGPLAALTLGAADRRRATLLDLLARLGEAAKQSAEELLAARRSEAACRDRLMRAKRHRREQAAEAERAEHIERRVVGAILAQGKQVIVD